MTLKFTTPVGRLVEGDPYNSKVQTDTSGLPKRDAAGATIKTTYVGLAVAKTDPAWPKFHADLMAEAKVAWPKFFDAAGNCTNPRLALKIKDGDGRDTKGNLHSAKQGHAGHWILALSRNDVVGPPRVVEKVSEGTYIETEKGKVKLGDYVRAGGNYASNQSTQTEGMYMNLDMILFEREGERIYIGTSAGEYFDAPGIQGAVPPAPANSATASTAATASGGVAPVPPPTSPAPAPPASGPQLTAKGAGTTYAAMIANGWTDETLVREGYMVAPYSGHMAAGPAPPPAPTAPAPPASGPRMTAKAIALGAGGTYAALKAAGWSDAQMIAQGYLEDEIPY